MRMQERIAEKEDNEARQELLRLIEKLTEVNATLGGMSLKQVADLAAGEYDPELIEDVKKVVSRVLELENP